METRRDVFQAIADPTRRGIIGLLAGQSLNLNAIAGQFDMSRQAVSLHVKILTECGLVTIRQQGRERYCEARLDALGEVAVWIAQYKQSWETRLDSLEHYLKTIQNTQQNAKQSE
jgi:DNA-binding transcriptional ArsR family regulator